MDKHFNKVPRQDNDPNLRLDPCFSTSRVGVLVVGDWQRRPERLWSKWPDENLL